MGEVEGKFLLTIREENHFVVLTDTAIIFNALRIPFETLLGHRNVLLKLQSLVVGNKKIEGLLTDSNASC